MSEEKAYEKIEGRRANGNSGSSKKQKTHISKKSIFLITGILIMIAGVWLFFHNSLIHSETYSLSGNDVNGLMSQDVVAKVNGKPIYTADFDKEVAITLLMQGIPLSYKSMIPKEQLLNGTITKELLLQEAQKQGYSSSKEDVGNLLMRNPLFNITQFTQLLSSIGVTYEDFVEYMLKQIVIQDFINKSVGSKINLSDKEIEDYYSRNQDMFRVDEKIRASHILVNTSEEAQELINKLDNGEDFATLAKENSIGPSASQGGDLGYFGKGQMLPEFEKAAFSLQKIGEYTKMPVKTKFGYHIIKLTGRQESRQLSFEKVKDQIKYQLSRQKENDIVEEYVAGLRERGDVEIYLKPSNNSAVLYGGQD